jgi:hypothetical protein
MRFFELKMRLIAPLVVLCCFVFFGSQSAHAACTLFADGVARGASDTKTVLILRATVTNDCASLEAAQAAALGLNVEIDDDATWGIKIGSEFATYRAIVLGDPHCVTGTGPITAAQTNKATWGPAITGPVAVLGTDPEFHADPANNVDPQKTTAAQLTQNAIALATSVPSKTGAYISLSCYYHLSAANTAVPVLDPFGTGAFTVQGQGAGSTNNSNIVAPSNPLVTTPNALTNAGLSNWAESTHEAFNSFPASFTEVVHSVDLNLAYIITGQTAGTTPTQSQPPQPLVVSTTTPTTNTFTFDSSTTSPVLVKHALTFPTDAAIPPGVDPNTLQIQSINIQIANTVADAPIWPQYVVGGPYSTSLLFTKSGDNTAGNVGSVYADACFDATHAASDDVCPSSASGGINVQDIFDIAGTKPDITPGTTAGMVHFLPTSGEAWTASTTTSNPVCTNTLGATGGIAPQPPQQCDLSDGQNFTLSGDQAGAGGGYHRKGKFATVNNILMLESLVSANGTPVNMPGVQGTGITWLNTHSVNLDFKVNPGGCPFPFSALTCPPASNAANNYFKPAPVASETYGVTGATTIADTVAGPAPDTSTVHQAEFNTNTSVVLNEGVNVVHFKSIDNAGTQEQNIQLLHPGSTTPCPNPYNLNPVPTYPCYSTTLFSVQIGVDTVPPAITITTPANGATYGVNQAVPAAYTCTDNESGVATCAGNVPSGTNIDTTPGAKTFTVNSTDKAIPPNASSKTVNYNVAYNFIGFGSPVSDTQVNLDHAGRAIPLSWQILDANNAGVDGVTLSQLNFSITPATCPSTSAFDNQITVTATGNSGLQNTPGGFYQLNWQTSKGWAGSCVGIQVDPGDGLFRPLSGPVVFQFSK